MDQAAALHSFTSHGSCSYERFRRRKASEFDLEMAAVMIKAALGAGYIAMSTSGPPIEYLNYLGLDKQ